MRRLVPVLAVVLVVALLPWSLSVSAAGIGKPAIGTPIGNVLETDIVARINGYAAQSFNIDNETAIIAEDLNNYGFDVTWNAQRRILAVNVNPGKALTPPPITPKTTGWIGRKVGTVLYTDIETYVGGTLVRSFNLGGKTAMIVDDLGRFGALAWIPEQRTIIVASRDSPERRGVRWTQVPADTDIPGEFVVASDGLYFRTVIENEQSIRQADLGALYFSSDGSTWDKTASATTHPKLLEVLCAAGPAGRSVLYGLDGEFEYGVRDVQLVRSHDRGRTWEAAGDFSLLATALWPARVPGLGELECVGSNTEPDNLLVSWWGGMAGHVRYSVDGGASWNDSTGISVPYLPVHIGPLTGSGSFWAQGVSPLCRSDDGGKSFWAVAEKWQNRPGEELMNAPLMFGAEGNLFQIGQGPMISEDKGQTWKPVHIPSWAKPESFTLAGVSPDRPGFLLGWVVENAFGQAIHRLVLSTDGGVSWMAPATDLGEVNVPPSASFGPGGMILLTTPAKAYTAFVE